MDQGVCGLLALGPSADRIRVGKARVALQRVNVRRLGRRRSAQTLTVGGDTGLHCTAEALPQVKPVSNLESFGGAASGTLGVGTCPVPTDDLHARVAGQPPGQRPRFACGEHVDHAMGFSAGQNGGVRLTPADREVVHAQHARRAELRIGQRHDPAQQGHPSCAEAQLGGQPGAGPSGQREPDSLQDVVEPSGEP